jgi:hypothetical protein
MFRSFTSKKVLGARLVARKRCAATCYMPTLEAICSHHWPQCCTTALHQIEKAPWNPEPRRCSNRLGTLAQLSSHQPVVQTGLQSNCKRHTCLKHVLNRRAFRRATMPQLPWCQHAQETRPITLKHTTTSTSCPTNRQRRQKAFPYCQLMPSSIRPHGYSSRCARWQSGSREEGRHELTPAPVPRARGQGLPVRSLSSCEHRGSGSITVFIPSSAAGLASSRHPQAQAACGEFIP